MTTTPFVDSCRVRSSRIHGRGLYSILAITRRRKIGELTGELRRLPAARQDHQLREVILIFYTWRQQRL